MHRKPLRGMSAQQSPLRSKCAMALLHTVIIAKLGSSGIYGYSVCGGNRTFATFAFFAAKQGKPSLSERLLKDREGERGEERGLDLGLSANRALSRPQAAQLALRYEDKGAEIRNAQPQIYL